MKTLRAALFDFDDTLMATRDVRLSLLVEVLEKYNYHIAPEDVAQNWGKPFLQLIESLAPGIDYQSFHQYYSKVMRSVPPRPLPGAIKILAKLRNHNVVNHVISSGSRDLVKQDIEDGDMLQYVCRIWGYEDTPSYKPNPQVLAPILHELRKQGIETDQIIYIGDSLSDFRIAKGNNIQFCGVLSGTDTRKDFRLAGMQNDMIVNSLKELLGETSWLNQRLEDAL